jgi:hypothetical protein
VKSIPSKLLRRTSNESGSFFQRAAPIGGDVGASAHVACTIAPGYLPNAQSSRDQKSDAPSAKRGMLASGIARSGLAWKTWTASCASATEPGTASTAK